MVRQLPGVLLLINSNPGSCFFTLKLFKNSPRTRSIFVPWGIVVCVNEQAKFEPEDYDPNVSWSDSPGLLYLTTEMILPKVNRRKLSYRSDALHHVGYWYKDCVSVSTMLLQHGLDRKARYWGEDHEKQITQAQEYDPNPVSWSSASLVLKTWIYYGEEILKLAGLRKAAFKNEEANFGEEPCADSSDTAVAVLTILTYLIDMWQHELTYSTSLAPIPHPIKLKKPRTYVQSPNKLTVNNEEFLLPDRNQLLKGLLENGYPNVLENNSNLENIDQHTGDVYINKNLIPIKIPGAQSTSIDLDTGALLLGKVDFMVSAKILTQAFYSDYCKYREMFFAKKWMLTLLNKEKKKYVEALLGSERLQLTYLAIQKEEEFKYPRYLNIEKPRLGY